MMESRSNFEQTALATREAGLVRQLFEFLWLTKKWWMVPIIIALTMLGVLIVVSSTAAAPFIYTLF